MTKGEFEYREYGRSELALLYCPGLEKMSAWRKLKRWIYRSPHLIDNLEAFGYEPTQRAFTPLQVRLIVNALGEP